MGGGFSHRDQTREQYQLQATVPRSRPIQIMNIEQWIEAFHVYVAVYCHAYDLLESLAGVR